MRKVDQRVGPMIPCLRVVWIKLDGQGGVFVHFAHKVAAVCLGFVPKLKFV